MSTSAQFLRERELLLLEPQWRNAVASVGGGNVFLGPDWYLSWSETFGVSRNHGAIAVTEASQLKALLPLVVDREHGIVGARLSMASAMDTDPDFMDVLAASETAASSIQSIVELVPRAFPNWSVLEFPGLHESSELLRNRRSLQTMGAVQFDVTGECPVVDLTGDYAGYLRSQFDKKKRYNIERQVKIAVEQQGLTLSRADSTHTVERCLQELFELHELRKNAVGTRTRFATQLSRDFHRRLAPRLLARDQLGLFVLRCADRPVSAMYGFFSGDSYFYYQSGLDPAWSKFSVGTVLLTLVIRECFQRQLAAFHFLRGDESYKSAWASRTCPYGRLRVYRYSVRGQTQRVVYLAKAALKGFVNARRGVTEATKQNAPGLA